MWRSSFEQHPILRVVFGIYLLMGLILTSVQLYFWMNGSKPAATG